jgi:hypothetical protein
VRKAMGLRKGEKAEPLRGPIRIVSTRAEPLGDITQADCVLKGFPEMQPADFVAMLEDHAGKRRGALAFAIVNRIEFAYTDPNPETP